MKRSATALVAAAILAGGTLAYVDRKLNEVPRHHPRRLRALRTDAPHPLFDRYPELADRIPWLPLGSYPTPVEELSLPDRQTRLFVKRDDVSSSAYGGNKVRKLEHFLADAVLRGSTSLVTLGAIGSNHALATATFGRQRGLGVDLFLYDQPLSRSVLRNLSAFVDRGATVHFARTLPRALVEAKREIDRRRKQRERPYFVMVGGTTRMGCIGHVTAGLELADQVDAGLLPEPDYLFVPLGTGGTAAGLIVGLRLAGLRTRVMAVRVADPFPANAFMLRRYAQDVASFLHSADRKLPDLRIRDSDFQVVTNHYAPGYGHPTAAGLKALTWASPRLTLETTYSGKALAACLEHCSTVAEDKTVLFWNTYSSAPLEAPLNLDSLPPALLKRLSQDDRRSI